MKNTTHLLGFLASFMISTGFIFKLLHWPFANIILVSGFILLNIGFLPLFFYGLYKKQKLES